jgi:hypothetical protein
MRPSVRSNPEVAALRRDVGLGPKSGHPIVDGSDHVAVMT